MKGQQGMTAGSWWVGVVSASLAKEGFGVDAGSTHGSLSNYPLQPTACGTLAPDKNRRRSHAAAERGR